MQAAISSAPCAFLRNSHGHAIPLLTHHQTTTPWPFSHQFENFFRDHFIRQQQQSSTDRYECEAIGRSSFHFYDAAAFDLSSEDEDEYPSKFLQRLAWNTLRSNRTFSRMHPATLRLDGVDVWEKLLDERRNEIARDEQPAKAIGDEKKELKVSYFESFLKNE
jgi:hypothetical protein